ncbi:MAG: HAD-IA family hydrolase [Clostridia bacterium]|nr:HAD-IA family hydrolase [Clostridia bacterium]MBQ8331366.1 HAD-IA family hydrolase [Clostridia bacterium]
MRVSPAPDIYQIAARKIGLAPAECLVFEDGTSGILSARAAGVYDGIVIHETSAPLSLERHSAGRSDHS